MTDFFFITGAARSGTTLLDKLCHNLPGVAAASQPYHQWYLDVRESYFSDCSEFMEPLPLFHHFPARPEWSTSFLDYMNGTLIDNVAMKKLLSNAVQGKGQATPGIGLTTPQDDQTWLSLWKHMHVALISALPDKSGVNVIGSKEIYCEDFTPFFVANGIRCIFSIRDIRDVITSMNYGSYREATRKPYPLLFNIRNWRKSVATALALKNHSNAMLLRYEDVVGSPQETLVKIGHFLGIQDVSEFPNLDRLRDQQGKPWLSNSSFGESASISENSSGRWHNVLPGELVALIEYLAGPELLAMGYSLTQANSDIEALFAGFAPEDNTSRAEYLSGNELDDSNLALETKRRSLLDEAPGQEDEKWFLYRHTAKELRNTWAIGK